MSDTSPMTLEDRVIELTARLVAMETLVAKLSEQLQVHQHAYVGMGKNGLHGSWLTSGQVDPDEHQEMQELSRRVF